MADTRSAEAAAEVALTDAGPSSSSRGKKFLLLVGSGLFCLIIFLALDAGYGYFFRKSGAPTREELLGCLTTDMLRSHALRADCSSVRAWGHERYVLSVDSEGFRDKTPRQVPLSDPRPRILMLGDSFTESMGPWDTSFVGRIANKFPQYDILNGGVIGYSPSTYLATARLALLRGLQIDEVVVFIDISDIQDEAGGVFDVGNSGAVTFAPSQMQQAPWYSNWRLFITQHLVATNYLLELMERTMVKFGWYYLNRGFEGNIFDIARSAWTYREVDETQPIELGYAPLGVQGGIDKARQKMDLLHQELARRNIPISVVVYPWPAQLIHDDVDSRQVRIWREWCAGKCKRFITAFPEFFAVKAQCSKWEPGCWYAKNYTFGDIHLNAGGNAIVAGVVSKALEDKPPVKRPAMQ